MRAPRVRRWLFVSCATGAVLLFAATSAMAGQSQQPFQRFMDQRSVWQAAPMAWSRAHVASAADVPYGSPNVTLQTGGRAVRIGGVTYQYGTTLSKDLSPGFHPAELEFGLFRGVIDPPRLAIQEHDYAFAPSTGLGFRFDRTTFAATLHTGLRIAPSSANIAFTPVHRFSAPCTLADGSAGAIHFVDGRLRGIGFKLVSGTSPFFGTVTRAPIRAELIYDPGCTESGSGPDPGGPDPFANRCDGREAVIAQIGDTTFITASIYGGGHTLMAADQTPVFSPTRFVDHFILADAPGATLPAPTYTAHGATARIRTAGNSFASGAGTFTSTTAPGISGVQHCRANGGSHAYRQYTYTGTIVSPAAAPLLVRFDTGAVAIRRAPGTLVILKYTS
jgi:hypothetical protein